jgi:Protein of unknown function (DUF3300)
MTGRLARIVGSVLMLHASCPVMLHAQPAPEAPPAPAQSAQTFNTEQLDALLAPIALYPDPLLTQTLMASTYPLQIVEADRWLEKPENKGLSGDALTKALEPLPWDPSVKSLVPFPQVLSMMSGNLGWTQQLGYAVADQQAAVMDSVQRLRRQTQSSGSLQTISQQVVRTEAQIVIIAPAQPIIVYVPRQSQHRLWHPQDCALDARLIFGAGAAITAGLCSDSADQSARAR